MKDQKKYFTPYGHQKYVDELNQLVKIERPNILKTIAWAAGNGDRSENADYIYGKRRLREIDRRIRFLNTRLDQAIVIDPASIQDDKIRFGATVKIVDEDGATKVFAIVGPDEIDTTKNHISFLSPIGKALMGKTVGDSITIKTPSGEIDIEIEEIIYRCLHT